MHDIIANSKMLILMQTCKLTIVILAHKLCYSMPLFLLQSNFNRPTIYYFIP